MPASKISLCIQVKVFWVAIPCSVALGYQCFSWPCCLHLQGEVNDTGSKGIDIGLEYKRVGGGGQLVSYHNTIHLHNPEDLDLNLHCHENFKSHFILYCLNFKLLGSVQHRTGMWLPKCWMSVIKGQEVCWNLI